MISGINETGHIKWKCKCRLDGIIRNSKQDGIKINVVVNEKN